MTLAEKRALARRLLRRNGYSEAEIDEIVKRAWGKEK